MNEMQKLAAYVETAQTYTEKDMGCRLMRDGKCHEPDTKVFLLDEKHRDLIVAALRAPEAADAGAVATDAQKAIYKKLAEEGGGTWATYMMMDIEEAYASPTAAGIAAPPADLCEKCKVPLKEGDDIFTTKTGLVHFPQCPKAAAPPAASADAVRALADLATLLKYARWTISAESPTHHPTMPSAVAQAEFALAVIAAALSAPVAGDDAGMRVSYHDEVTAEQVAAIEKLVAPEFEGGGWVEVESEAFLASGEADAAPASYGKQHLTGPAIDAIENAQDTDKEEMDATLPGRAFPGVELIEIPLGSRFLTECPNMKAYAVKTDVLATLSQRPSHGGEAESELGVTSYEGREVTLQHDTIINGIRHEAGRYRMQRVGPPAEDPHF